MSETEDQTLQRICEEVEAEWRHGPQGANNILFAKAVARRYAATVGAGGWQPIETAPKDGTPFLAYWLRSHTDGSRYEAAQPYVVAHYMSGQLFPSWIAADDQPTHWRPLDAPPSP